VGDFSSAIKWDHLTALTPWFHISTARFSVASTSKPQKWTYHFKASEQEQNHVSGMGSLLPRRHLVLCGMSDFYSVSRIYEILSKTAR